MFWRSQVKIHTRVSSFSWILIQMKCVGGESGVMVLGTVALQQQG